MASLMCETLEYHCLFLLLSTYKKLIFGGSTMKKINQLYEGKAKKVFTTRE